MVAATSTMDWSTVPAAAAPSGQTSNLIDPVNHAYKVLICNTVCLVIVFFFVGLRLYTRLRVVKSIGSDDYCAIAALVLFCGEAGLFGYATYWGAGKHIWDVSVADLYPHLLRDWVVAAVMYSITMLAIKLSILLLYRRLFPIGNFMTRWWIVITFTVGYSIGGALSSLFQCTPIDAAWSLNVASDYCINTEKFYIANASLNVFDDLLILALPIPIVWSLSLMKLRQKITLSVLFFIGSLSCIVSVLRLVSIVTLYHSGSQDLTWSLVNTIVWSQLELTAAIVCACVPTLRPFLEHHMPSLFTPDSSQRDSFFRSSYHHGNAIALPSPNHSASATCPLTSPAAAHCNNGAHHIHTGCNPTTTTCTASASGPRTLRSSCGECASEHSSETELGYTLVDFKGARANNGIQILGWNNDAIAATEPTDRYMPRDAEKDAEQGRRRSIMK